MNSEQIKQTLQNRRLLALVVALLVGAAATFGISLPTDEFCAVAGEDQEVLIHEIISEVLNPSVDVEITEASDEPTATPQVTSTP